MSLIYSALIVIDVQLGLFTDKTPIYKEEELIENINLLIDSARSTNTLIVFIQHSNDTLLEKDSEGYNYHPDIHLQEDDLIYYKTKGSVFEENDLHSFLQSKGITTLFITGLMTNACIKNNSIASHKLGYEVFLVQDAHSTCGDEKKGKKKVDGINKKLSTEGIVELISTDDVSFSL